MPTYRFHCTDCDERWTERQNLSSGSVEHTSSCPKCGEVCQNNALGGSGFQFAGRYMNKQLEGFPDYTNKINQDAMKDAEQMEKIHDAKRREDTADKD